MDKLALSHLIEEVESTITTAKQLNYKSVSIDMPIAEAKDLVEAVTFYLEPRFYGWPKSLVELWLAEEDNVPEHVFYEYEKYMKSLIDSEASDCPEEFFIDAEYGGDL